MLRHVPEDDTPVNLPASGQRAEDRVSDHDHHPGWLVRVDDRNQKFEKLSLLVVPAVPHGIPVFGIDLMHKSSFMVALHLVGQPETSSQKVIRIAPQIGSPELWAIPDSAVEDIRSLRLHHLLDQLLLL